MLIDQKTTLWCRPCAAWTRFEVPPCVEGHADCPDAVCVECGYAVIIGSALDVNTAVEALVAA